MMDLLVGSLMADGGLESSLQTAIKVEIQDMEDARVSSAVLYTIRKAVVQMLPLRGGTIWTSSATMSRTHLQQVR